jgi:hypothetical protein
LPLGFTLYGPALDITLGDENFSPAARTKLIEVFPRPLLGCAVLGPGDSAASAIPAMPEGISFRAAAVANLRFGKTAKSSGDPAFSFSWTIGELYWLPAPRRAKGETP